MGNFNALSKFESQILSYKQDTEFGVLCFVKKNKELVPYYCDLLVYNSTKCCFLLLIILFMITLNQFTLFNCHKCFC